MTDLALSIVQTNVLTLSDSVNSSLTEIKDKMSDVNSSLQKITDEMTDISDSMKYELETSRVTFKDDLKSLKESLNYGFRSSKSTFKTDLKHIKDTLNVKLANVVTNDYLANVGNVLDAEIKQSRTVFKKDLTHFKDALKDLVDLTNTLHNKTTEWRESHENCMIRTYDKLHDVYLNVNELKHDIVTEETIDQIETNITNKIQTESNTVCETIVTKIDESTDSFKDDLMHIKQTLNETRNEALKAIIDESEASRMAVTDGLSNIVTNQETLMAELQSIKALLTKPVTASVSEVKMDEIKQALMKQTPIYTPVPIHTPSHVVFIDPVSSHTHVKTKFVGKIKLTKEDYPVKMFDSSSYSYNGGSRFEGKPVVIDEIYKIFNKCCYYFHSGQYNGDREWRNVSCIFCKDGTPHLTPITPSNSPCFTCKTCPRLSTQDQTLYSSGSKHGFNDFTQGLYIHRITPVYDLPIYSPDLAINKVHQDRYKEEYNAYFVNFVKRLIVFPTSATIAVKIGDNYKLLKDTTESEYKKVECILADAETSFNETCIVKFVRDFIQIYEETV
jgi:DNA anti-recombination protein RmuC